MLQPVRQAQLARCPSHRSDNQAAYIEIVIDGFTHKVLQELHATGETRRIGPTDVRVLQFAARSHATDSLGRAK